MHRNVNFVLWSLAGALAACTANVEDAPEDVGQGGESIRAVVDPAALAEPISTSDGTSRELVRTGGWPVKPVIPPKPIEPRPPVLLADPQHADLEPYYVMPYHLPSELGVPETQGGSRRQVFIQVMNLGPGVITASAGRVSIDGLQFDATLRTAGDNPNATTISWGPTASVVTTTNPLAAGAIGYFWTDVPAWVVAACTNFRVKIDLDQTIQWQIDGAPIYANDEGIVKTQCMHWNDKLTLDLVEYDYQKEWLENRSIADIVGGFKAAVPAGLCTHCHHSDENLPRAAKYHPPVHRDGQFTIGKHDVVDGRTWDGPDGWAHQFSVTAYPKPTHMREVFNKWLSEGTP